jgi:hypothetical protein
VHCASVQSMREGCWYIAMSKPPVGGVLGFDFVGHVSSLIGILRRQLSLHLLTRKCPRFLEVRWSTLCVTMNWLNERISKNHLQDILAGRGMSWQSTSDAAANIVWLQFWLVICAFNAVLRRVDAAFTRMQGFQSTITEVQSVYNGLCADMKTLVGVVTLDGDEDNPVGSVVDGSYYVTMGSLRQFLDGEIVSNDIIE